jgi:hypothetical protein
VINRSGRVPLTNEQTRDVGPAAGAHRDFVLPTVIASGSALQARIARKQYRGKMIRALATTSENHTAQTR